MNATTIVALAGIGGTLAGSIAAPLVAGKSARANREAERIADARAEAYVEMLAVLFHLRGEVLKTATRPDLTPTGVDDDRLLLVEAKADALASDAVREAVGPLTFAIGGYWALLASVQSAHGISEIEDQLMPQSQLVADSVEAVVGIVREELGAADRRSHLRRSRRSRVQSHPPT